MRMKKLLAIFLSTVLLLSLAACGENITPTTDDPYDAPVTENTPKKTSLPFEVGALDVVSGEDEYALATWDDLKQNKNFQNGLSQLFVDVISDSETCREMISPNMLEAYENNEFLAEKFQERRDHFYRYDEAFFEEKELISLTFWSADTLFLEVVKLQTYVDADGTTQYHVILRVSNSTTLDNLIRENIVLEVDKDLGITPENLTVEIRDKRIGR